ncbi:ECF-type sigma factor [Aureliella helgolandensis]|uniref:RNA polymerase sigma factor SigL n=1 Tax=Aureliella helgolandensis TaxID=2527968 RepID=A0A518G7X3_9BACT|nr:ECF-type sigma factor [Aureliella helgolandensis]QDV24680.1 RNA polymerase sigma factor SigL [Aureliella helgolandensis]
MSEDVTKILLALEAGDRQAASQLLPLVYDELRKLAARRMVHEKAALTLQPTALVHEAYLRLVGPQNAANWDGRGHFFAAAAEAMRRILIDNARRRGREKRGGDRVQVDLHDEHAFNVQTDAEDLLSLDEALTKLAGEDAQLAKLVELKYFAGMTIDETAQVLGVSPRTIKRNWAYARAWLRRHMEGMNE